MASDVELLNELKRLQDVIIQLQASNTNLASVITQLQAQVAQQIITNTNLTAQIATLTTITGQLVEVNTRALDERDQANQPLPYDDITLNYTWPGTIANGASDGHTFTAANWGAGLDFYISGFLVQFNCVAETLMESDNEILIYLYDTTAPEYFYRHTFSGEKYSFSNSGLAGWMLSRSFLFPHLRRVTSTQNIRYAVYNGAGNAIGCFVEVNGIPK